MKIRCKKCFKKYDDHIGECPRCGAINDRDYSGVVEHVKPEIKKTTLSDKFIKKYHCSFCHTAKLFKDSKCPYCKNSLNLKDTNPTLSSDTLDNAASDLFKETEGIVSKKKFTNLLASKGFDVKTWQAPYDYKFGLESSILLIIGVVAFVMLIIFGTLSSEHGSSFLFGLIMIMIVSTILYFMRHLFFTEYLLMSKLHESNTVQFAYRKKSESGRDGLQSILDVTTSKLKKIEIEVDEESGQCLRMILHTKEDVGVSLRVVDVDVRHYQRRGHVELILLLLLNTLDLPLFVKRLKSYYEGDETEIVEAKESESTVYVRIDQYNSEPSVELCNAQKIYLSLIKEDRYLTSGSLDKYDYMMLFEAKSKEEAIGICDNDPFVLNNIVQYTLREWDVNIGNLWQDISTLY